MYDSRGQCSEKGASLARSSRCAFPKGSLQGFSDTWSAYLAKASSFWMHGGDMLPGRRPFPVRGPFRDAWSEKIATARRPRTHRTKILPRTATRERTTAKYRRRRTLGDATDRRRMVRRQAKQGMQVQTDTIGAAGRQRGRGEAAFRRCGGYGLVRARARLDRKEGCDTAQRRCTIAPPKTKEGERFARLLSLFSFTARVAWDL